MFHYPYEVCSKENTDFTDRMVQESQDLSFNNIEAKSVCLNCNRKRLSTVSKLKMAWQRKGGESIVHTISQTNDIPPICFLTAMLHAPRWQHGAKNYYHCSSARSNNPIKLVKLSSCTPGRCTAKPQRPCFNQKYVEMTAKAFNETANCFGFSSRYSKENLFALMNHESSFVLNQRAVSNEGEKENTARCYGQIKHPIIVDTNKYIHYGNEDPNWDKYHKIYRDVRSRCPNIAKRATSFNKCQTWNKMSRQQFIRCMTKNASKTAKACQTSQDPYSCLFYTLYNVRRNEVAYQNITKAEFNRRQKELQAIQRSIKKEDISPAQKRLKLSQFKQMAKDFKWPIALNEILLFKGYISPRTGGKTVYKEYLFRSTKEMYQLFSNINYNPKEVAVKKSAIFNEDQLKWTFLHLAHNGGVSVINSHFLEFMKYIKKHRINPKNRHHKAFFIKGNLIRTHRLAHELKGYAIYSKRKVVNAKEVAKFMQNINKDLKNISNPFLIKNRLKNLAVKNNLDSIQVAALAKEVRERCPDKIF